MSDRDCVRITNIPPCVEWLPEAAAAFKAAFDADIMDDANGTAWYFYGVGIDRSCASREVSVNFVYRDANNGSKWRSAPAPVSFYDRTSGYVRCGRCEAAVQWEQDATGVYLDCLACGKCKSLIPATIAHFLPAPALTERDLGEYLGGRDPRTVTR